ncbi:alpha/beta fold hydrolase [Parachryseolinea silvisoli]|uniref:alpha/beta fold hydrolase n=1 Tax=Parachryseolinea silvisoli TaxID=2873601 RepID=UPI002265B0D7|nr:alpha/beta fold hydrolase [Parachryseolinea silvisoli]MCD9019201.1 alpha/beta fold hydrolase [Parachryseolinea silvisoli]
MEKTILALLSTAFILSAFATYTGDEDNTAATNTYVLVHGAWQAPYVWDAVRTDLVNKGNQVIIVQLPGHGDDNTPPQSLTLDVYSNKVIEAVSETKGNVILVGHSMGGMVVTNVAEKIPTRIRKLVYIAAFLPASGQALTDLAYSDPDSQLGPALVPSADKLTLDVLNNKVTDLFVSDGSPTDKKRVIENYRPEPAIPFSNKVSLTDNHFGTVSKVYIKTLNDVVISPGLQDRMITVAGIKTVYQLKTSHSPFLSKPHDVSDLLLKIAR